MDIVQDALADLVRIMLVRCYDQDNFPLLYDHCRNLRGEVWLCAFPNLFITIAPAEWKFPRPYFLAPYTDCVFACAYIMALHMYYLVRCVWNFLSNRFGNKYFIVYEWCMKTEYQGRGTPHWHLALWVVSFGLMSCLQGRTGSAVVSAFVKFLQLLFVCEIDVQIGNGRLNYINGYVSKDHDAVDVGLGEYVQKNACAPWLSAYRLLSKSSPCLPEVAIRMAQLSEFERSYSHVLLYPPQPAAMVTLEGRQGNFSARMYGFYLQEKRQEIGCGNAVSESFLVWHRTRQYDNQNHTVRYRGGHNQQSRANTLVVACRFWYELTDGYWGQFSLVNFPHMYARDLLPKAFHHIVSMQNFAGMLEYLCAWRWSQEPGIVRTADGCIFRVTALPFLVDDMGDIMPVAVYAAEQPVFSSDFVAFKYVLSLAKRDLQYRGMRDDRISCFHWKQDANFLLYSQVKSCTDEHEYKCLQQQWDTVNRPKYQSLSWSAKQNEALALMKKGVSLDDEDERCNSRRWLYLAGSPGCGKSAVLLEIALWACKAGYFVLIICPTGFQVHSYKARLPEIDGIENITIDTIHGVLRYKRKGKDSKVTWAPPSALRQKELILMEEASQYEDLEWTRMFECIREQPHKPFTCVVADFKQLQPIVSGGMCKKFCETMQTVELDTVYRSTDEEHLLFINRIRMKQPSRDLMLEYWGDRYCCDAKGPARKREARINSKCQTSLQKEHM